MSTCESLYHSTLLILIVPSQRDGVIMLAVLRDRVLAVVWQLRAVI